METNYKIAVGRRPISIMDSVETADRAARAIARKEEGCLTFSLGNQDHSRGSLKVSEIIGMLPIATVSENTENVKGTILFRTEEIPVIDLRRLLGMEETGYGERSRIAIVEAPWRPDGRQFGIIVDAVTAIMLQTHIDYS